MATPLYLGTAGWSISSRYASTFATAGTHLERYAARFNSVEINSSFSASHQQITYARWARSVPAAFRFAVKVPRTLTHENRLENFTESLDTFLTAVSGLGNKLGALLVQLPPSLPFDESIANAFFAALLSKIDVPVVCEPRHASWNTPDVEAFLAERRIARVAADPAPWPEAAEPAGWRGLAYFRFHGRPRTYYSDYDAAALEAIRAQLESALTRSNEVWCVFDNTALGH